MNAAAAPNPPFQKTDAPALILASGSAARQSLLAAVGLRFAVQPVAIDETAIKQSCRAEGNSAAETAVLLAEMKAARVRAPGAVVIGADQLLVCGDEWFDKPTDRASARAQLRALRGKTHRLVTALSLQKNGEVIWHHVETPELRMRDFTDEFLEAYLSAEIPAILGCVGAYRLEGPGVQLFERVSGEHSAILGLPMVALLGFLRQHGVVLK